MRHCDGGPSDAADIKGWPAGASPRYVAARNELLEAERDLLDQVKRVASLRQALPSGPALPAYAFAEGPGDLTREEPVVTTTLAELVGARALFVYHMMFAPDREQGCPSCSMWVDGLNLDVGAEDPDGGQWPRVSVFVKRDDVVYHRYTTALIDNALDLLTPVWHIEDLLPQGRGDFEPRNTYAGPQLTKRNCG